MELSDTAQNWERLARTRPYWSILTDGDSTDLDAFYESGRVAVVGVLEQATRYQELSSGSALDFGCGAGRLTRALAARYGTVTGVDISETMVSLARAHTPEPNVTYLVNNSSDLSILGRQRFDFVLSMITLQHVTPVHAEGYVRELVRVLEPGGIATLHAPDLALRGRLRRAASPLVSARNRIRMRWGPVMEMHGLPVAAVTRAVATAGGIVLDHTEDGLYIIARRSA